jgi:hypothetical protein
MPGRTRRGGGEEKVTLKKGKVCGDGPGEHFSYRNGCVKCKRTPADKGSQTWSEPLNKCVTRRMPGKTYPVVLGQAFRAEKKNNSTTYMNRCRPGFRVDPGVNKFCAPTKYPANLFEKKLGKKYIEFNGVSMDRHQLGEWLSGLNRSQGRNRILINGLRHVNRSKRRDGEVIEFENKFPRYFSELTLAEQKEAARVKAAKKAKSEARKKRDAEMPAYLQKQTFYRTGDKFSYFPTKRRKKK